jgi:hypothetical protein
VFELHSLFPEYFRLSFKRRMLSLEGHTSESLLEILKGRRRDKKRRKGFGISNQIRHCSRIQSSQFSLQELNGSIEKQICFKVPPLSKIIVFESL